MMLSRLAWLLIWIYIVSTSLFCRYLVAYLSVSCSLFPSVFFSLAFFSQIFAVGIIFIFNFTEERKQIYIVQRLHRLEVVPKAVN